MPKQRILILALKKMQDLRKQNAALKRENDKLTMIAQRRDAELEASALTALKNASANSL